MQVMCMEWSAGRRPPGCCDWVARKQRELGRRVVSGLTGLLPLQVVRRSGQAQS